MCGKLKPLYVVVIDCGDGSYHPGYTFNSEWVLQQEQAAQNGELDFGSGMVDGDGFHYDVLMVPECCTLQSLGIVADVGKERPIGKPRTTAYDDITTKDD